MRRGFTLVELSIVLVIIGLLIGGILAAQSMINTSKIVKSIDQLTQLEVAVQNFITKYNQLPGDSNIFTPPGNNNRADNPNGYETGAVWAHLSQGVGLKNYVGNDYVVFDVFGPPWSNITAANCPQLAMDSDRSDPINQPCISFGWYETEGWLGYGRTNTSTPPTTTVVKPIDAKAIDSKIDDGIATTGNMGAGWNGGVCRGGDYMIDNTGYVCNLEIRAGTLVGQKF